MKRFAWLIVLAVVVAAGVWGYRTVSGGARMSVKTVSMARGALRMTVETTGGVQPLITVNVGCEVSGTVGELMADFNSIVKKGQPLARLRPELFEADLKQSEANVLAAKAQVNAGDVEVSRARRQVKRLEDMAKRSAAAPEEVATADENLRAAVARLDGFKASLLQAEAARDLNRTKLDRSIIYAPMDGIILQRLVDVGQTVAVVMISPVLFVMAPDLDRTQVHANVSESDIGNVRIGQSAQFTVDAYPQREFSGTLTQVRNNPTTIQGVVTYTVVIDVDNRERLLKPGMTANVVIEVARRDQALKVANAALRFRPPLSAEALAELTGNLSWPKPSDDPPAASQAPGDDAPTGQAAPASKTLPRVQGLVWQYTSGQWTPVPVLLGITDNRETEVLAGGSVGLNCVQSVQMSGGAAGLKEALKLANPEGRSL
ncbi:MAG: efflux RND transporter periplasmic adaptor subunit [Phycisphaerae bacterium]